ncbi:MAG: hypothetical protein II839_08540 [Kiritimatiellae bacterium]|nr:hypothetical protein [Kiritimatiellia bacterium]
MSAWTNKSLLLLLAAASALAETPFGLFDETNTLYSAADVDAATNAVLSRALRGSEALVLAATTNLSARPVALAPGQTDIDAHGDAHNGPVALGEGARAAVDTTGLSTTIRSVSVAIGAGADARDLANPAKQQAIALGNQSRAAAVNSIAIGSGVRHDDETDLTGGNAYAAAPQAIAIGYSAKAVTNDAVQIGPGLNDEPGTLKFRDTTIVRNGRLATDGLDTNAVRRMIQAESEKGLMYGSTGSTNGFAYIRMSGYNAVQDTDPEFILAVHTNENADIAASFPIYPGSPHRRDVYSAATVDKLLAAKADAGSKGEIARRVLDELGAALLPVPYAEGRIRGTNDMLRVGAASGLLVGGARDLGDVYAACIISDGMSSVTNAAAALVVGTECAVAGRGAEPLLSGIALGCGAVCTNDLSFVWNGDETVFYGSRGPGTICLNPASGADGIYIGRQTLRALVRAIVAEELLAH